MRGGVDCHLEQGLEEVLDDVLEAVDTIGELVDVVQPGNLDEPESVVRVDLERRANKEGVVVSTLWVTAQLASLSHSWMFLPVEVEVDTVQYLHCTLYTVHCTLYTVHCTLYTVHCTQYTTVDIN